jgi:hypothetical protein
LVGATPRGLVPVAVGAPVAAVPAVVLLAAVVPEAVALAETAVPRAVVPTDGADAVIPAVLLDAARGGVAAAFEVSLAPPPPQAASISGNEIARSATNRAPHHDCPSNRHPLTIKSLPIVPIRVESTPPRRRDQSRREPAAPHFVHPAFHGKPDARRVRDEAAFSVPSPRMFVKAASQDFDRHMASQGSARM